MLEMSKTREESEALMQQTSAGVEIVSLLGGAFEFGALKTDVVRVAKPYLLVLLLLSFFFLHHPLEFAKPISLILLPSSCSRICEPSTMFAWKNSVSVSVSVSVSLLEYSWTIEEFLVLLMKFSYKLYEG
jgi:hypothetical protein